MTIHGSINDQRDIPGSRDGNSDGSTRQRPRRTTLIRTPCKRCQKRKIRCDGAAPSCSSCNKSGNECLYEDRDRHRDSNRPYVSALENRVRWLESIVRQRCPDVDLTRGPALNSVTVPDSPDYVGSTFLDLDDEVTELPALRNQKASPALESNRGTSGRRPEILNQSIRPEVSIEDINASRAGLAHEIGLVALSAGNDPKYVGPSSGYFFTQMLLSASAKTGDQRRVSPELGVSPFSDESVLSQELFRSTATELPTSKDFAVQLSDTFFKTVHKQYPFLHRPTYRGLIDHVYDCTPVDPTAAFQVNMVLSISAIILSRRTKVPLPGEGWCASAMEHFGKMSIETSVRGTQCLLLLLTYAMYSPSTKLNAWYLNYQCIAMVLDLGLQRDSALSASTTPLEQEMKRRIFWVVYSIDRSLATMMGRPIGLRDEACELRLPADIDDEALVSGRHHARGEEEPPTHMSHAIHLFNLSKITSEIKYVLHSISRNTLSYAYPAIRDLSEWQTNIAHRLDDWASRISQQDSSQDYIVKLCLTRYYSVKMLLLRPSPGIPHPTPEALRECYSNAISATRLFNELYKRNMLVYSWMTFHSIMLSTITMFYCIWTVPEIAHETKLDALMADLRAASNILSATGEHWSGARRSRDLLDELASNTIRRIIELRSHTPESSEPYQQGTTSNISDNTLTNNSAHDLSKFDEHVQQSLYPSAGSHFSFSSFAQVADPVASLFDDRVGFGSSGFLAEGVDVDVLMREVFEGFIPAYTRF